MSNLKEEVLEFINRRFSTDCNWMNGNCYYFALILSTRFPKLTIYYLPITGHFVAMDKDGSYYDYEGYHESTDEPAESLFSIAETDSKLYGSLVRDCIK